MRNLTLKKLQAQLTTTQKSLKDCNDERESFQMFSKSYARQLARIEREYVGRIESLTRIIERLSKQ
jgi:hypothetical protein